MNEETTKSRVRMNLKTTAKGDASFDITSEAETVEAAKDKLGTAIDGVRAVCVEKGLRLASDS